MGTVNPLVQAAALDRYRLELERIQIAKHKVQTAERAALAAREMARETGISEEALRRFETGESAPAEGTRLRFDPPADPAAIAAVRAATADMFGPGPDPDVILGRIRDGVAEWEGADMGSSEETEAAQRLSGAFCALDDWLSHGGRLPADWAETRTG